jgi:hypothetical protein
MSDELFFSVRGSEATPAQLLSLAEAGLRERRHLQEWVVAHPEILGPEIIIVTMEFDRWQSPSRRNADRLDILGLHSSGELVVAELKRDRAPDTIEMQAIKYSAMASRFTAETLAEQHSRFLTQRNKPTDTEAAAELLAAHAEITIEALRRPRIVLLASEYPEETVATAVWLREMGIDIKLMQYRAFRSGQEISIAVSQLYPIPSIEDFTISPRQAEVRAVQETRRRRQDAGTVAKLVAATLIEDGAQLTVKPRDLNPDLREKVETWLNTMPARREATWRTDASAPLVWAADGQTYSPSGLARLIITEATGVDRSIRGGGWWVDSEGRDLIELAAESEGERAALYYGFWSELVQRSTEEHPDWRAMGGPSTLSWFNFAAGWEGSVWDLAFGHKRRMRSGLYITNSDPAVSLGTFERFRTKKTEIEDRYGGPLEWEEPAGRRYCRITVYRSGDITHTDEYAEMIAWFLTSQSLLREALNLVPAQPQAR